MTGNPYQSPSTAPRKQVKDWLLCVDLDAEEVGERIERFFSQNGYRLESGNRFDGYYGIGNDFRRLIFGAFAKRYKFHVTIEATTEGTVVQVEKGISGVMGGAVGYTKMKKELQRVRDEIEARFR